MSYLQTDFKCKNSSKKIIRDPKIKVPKAVLVNWVFRSERDAGDEDDEHDEVIKELLSDKPVDCLANSEKFRFSKLFSVLGFYLALKKKIERKG